METKDLAILLAIPIGLIIIIAYTNQVSITGAAVFEEQTKIIGKYSIMPSFKVSADYNINYIKELRQKLKSAIESCNKRTDIENCLKAKSTEFGWDCTDKEAALHDFTAKLNDCKNLPYGDVVCKLFFDENPSINKDNKDVRVFEIKFTNWYQKIKAELFENGNLVETEFINLEYLSYVDNFDNKNEKKPEEINIRISYILGKPQVFKIYAVINNQEIDLSKTMYLYKGSSVNFIDESIESSFSASPPNTIINLPKTRGIKFCAKNGDIEYNFAVRFPKNPPVPISSLKLSDAQKKEDAAVVQWKQDGAVAYNLYSSMKSFDLMKIDDIRKDPEIVEISFNPKDAVTASNLENIEKGKLYLIGNDFTALIKTKDGTAYFAAVTAVDEDGNELDNDKSLEGNTMVFGKGNYGSVVSIDDVAPSKISNLNLVIRQTPTLEFTKPLKNIDGTDAVDVLNFNVYYKEGVYDFIDNSFKVKSFTAISSGCSGPAISCAISLDLAPGTYSIGVVALDEKNNADMAAEVKQFFIP